MWEEFISVASMNRSLWLVCESHEIREPVAGEKTVRQPSGPWQLPTHALATGLQEYSVQCSVSLHRDSSLNWASGKIQQNSEISGSTMLLAFDDVSQ